MEVFSLKAFRESKPPIALKSIINKMVNAYNGFTMNEMRSWVCGSMVMTILDSRNKL